MKIQWHIKAVPFLSGRVPNTNSMFKSAKVIAFVKISQQVQTNDNNSLCLRGIVLCADNGPMSSDRNM